MKFIYYTLLVLCLFSCNKKNTYEFVENPIYGKLYYLDTASGISDKIPLAATTVYLTNSASNDNYIISTETDSAGYFIFTHTPNTSTYLFAMAENNEKGFYNLITAKVEEQNELILLPNQSVALNILLLDSTNIPVNGINVKLYINYNIAYADSLITGGTGSIANDNSNVNGVATFTGLNSRRYYIRVNDSINGIAYNKFTSFDYIQYQKTDTTLIIQ